MAQGPEGGPGEHTARDAGRGKRFPDNFQKTMTNIIENLRGDALNVAMDIGVTRLSEKDGISHLVAEMKKFVFNTNLPP